MVVVFTTHFYCDIWLFLQLCYFNLRLKQTVLVSVSIVCFSNALWISIVQKTIIYGFVTHMYIVNSGRRLAHKHRQQRQHCLLYGIIYYGILSRYVQIGWTYKGEKIKHGLFLWCVCFWFFPVLEYFKEHCAEARRVLTQSTSGSS